LVQRPRDRGPRRQELRGRGGRGRRARRRPSRRIRERRGGDRRGGDPDARDACGILALMEKWHATTVLCVRHQGKVAMVSDGQVTLGTTVMKQTAAKIRRLKGGDVLAGFAGSSADAFALFSRFEMKLEEHRGNLERSAIELAKD